MQPRGTHTLLVAILVAVAAFISSASAHADVPAAGDFSPAVWSDKADYSPGEHVVLSGANWQPGESVRVTVNDDAGSTWNRTVDVTADGVGSISDEFDLPSWFVALYSVRAEGASGSVATYSFTDGNVKFDVVPGPTTITETTFANTTCTAPGTANPPLTHTVGDTVGGVKETESVRLDAAANDDNNRAFSAWSSTDTPATPFTVISGTSGRSICVKGSKDGTLNFRATYAGNTAPVATGDSYSVNEDATLTVAAPGVLSNDTDADNNTLTAQLVSSPANGSLSLNANGAFTYTPAANYNGSDSFTYKARDGVADSNTVTVSITVNSVNDAPAGANGTVTTNEDADYTFVASDFGFSDPNDSPANTLAAVRITTLATSGSIRNNGTAVTAGAVIPLSDITAGNLRFRPAANAKGSPYATFTFQVQDNGGTANGGIDLDQSANTLTVNVNSVNDAPAGADTSVTIDEDGSYTFASGDFGFTDPNDSPANALASVTITTLPANGTLKNGTTAVTAGQVVPVAQLSDLTFTPAANANGTPYTNFTFQVTDDGGSANGGVDTDQSANTFTVNVRSVNDAPAGANKTVSTPEDMDYTFTTGDFGFSDANDSPANALAAVKITTTATPGSLKDNGSAVTDGQLVPVADISGGKLKFSPAGSANGAGYAMFTFQVQDNGGTANGGVDTDQSANTITIDVTPVNDRPTAASSPASLTVDEDAAARTFSLSGSDAETPSDHLTFTITHAPAHGALEHGTSTLATNDTFTGGPEDVTYTPDADYNGGDDFKFTVTDRGDPDTCGTPGGFCDAKSMSTEVTVPITINSVNDAPAGANKTITTTEDSDYTLTAADFGFSDPHDSPADTLAAVRITTTASHGTLKNNGSDVTDGQVVSAADIAGGKLKFRPAANANGAGYASFTFQVQDNGATANGGIDLDQSANTITVDVTSVNDAPAGADNTVSTDEDTAYTFATSEFGFSDPDDSPANALLAVKITTLPTDGTLKLGTDAVSAGDFVSATDINAGNLKFHPAADANGAGYAGFTFQVQDDGGTANGGADLDPSADKITVDVTAVNDAPAGADTTVTTDEDTDYALQTADFGFTDPQDASAPNSLTAVIIASAPTHGTLTDDGTLVGDGDVVTAAHIAAGDLVFHPVADKNGSPYATFTFQVQDDGGTGNGGADTDQSANTITVDVSPVNDKPTASADPDSLTIDEDSGTHPVALGGADVETHAADLTFKVTQAPTHGTLKQGTDTLAANAMLTGSPQNVTYEPAADFHGADSVKFTVTDRGDPDNCDTSDPLCDAALSSSEVTLPITVGSVNDAPAGADKTVTTLEDTAYTVHAADFGFSDTHDSPANTLASVVIAQAPTHGVLKNGSATVADGDEISGADLSAGNVRFHPAANADGAGYDSFTFQVRDNGGTANSGVDLDPVANTITVDVTPVNDAPSGTSNTVTTLEDSAHTFASSEFGFSDPDDSPANALLAVKITTLPADGTLKLGTDDVSAGDFVSVADIDAGDLKFHPAANANGNGYASFTFQVQDDGGTDNDGANLDQTANTMTVDVTPVNDGPDGTDTTVTTDEDTDYAVQTVDFGFTDATDAPAADDLKSVVITAAPTTGTLTDAGVTVTDGDEISAADIADAKLKFHPVADANGASYDSFTFQVRDDGGTDNGGVDLDPVTNTITVDVTPVNDRPTASADPGSRTIDEDSGTHTFALSGDDVETHAADLKFTITHAPAHGTLKHGGDPLADDATFTGSPQDVTYEPAANFHGDDGFTFTVTDRGDPDDCGTAGPFCEDALSSEAVTVPITVTSVNDAPSGADNTVTTDEDTAYTFAAADFGFTDPADSPADALAAVKVTTLPGAGTLKNGTTDLAAGDFVSIADINAGNLKFHPAANANGDAYASFTFQVRDDGGTDNGGVDLDPSADKITVDVTSVNDEPAGGDATVTTTEDHGYVVQTADVGFSDPSDTPANALAAVIVETSPIHGTLTDDGTTVVAGSEVSAAHIAAGKLVFHPVADKNGSPYATFTFQVRDNGGTANDGQDTDQTPNTLTVNVTPVNDAPSGSDGAVSTDEDTPYAFVAANFGFSDPTDAPSANSLKAVKIATLPAAGTLKNGTTDLAAGDFVSIADINAGNLKFHPAANTNGSGYAGFTFQVQDDGGTSDGGVDLDPSANTITINVKPVNDKPTATATPSTLTLDEDGSTGASLSATDVETTDAANMTFKITTAPAHGTLKQGTTTLTAGATFSPSQNVTYTPDADYNGSDSLKFSVTDRGDPDNCGSVGTYCDAAKSDELTVPITVNPVNDAPVLHTSGTPKLADIVANDPNNGGTSIEDLISSGDSGYITDVDAGAVQGIAVTGAATANGSWQFSTDGSTWTALGSVSDSNARLLFRSTTTKIRFVPNTDYTGSDPTITFRAWDRTSGSNGDQAPATPNGGIYAFSADTDTAGITVQKRAVTVTESCAPATVVVGQSTTCTTTVKDTEGNGNKSNPAGAVNAANTVGTGSVAASPCTLSGVSPSSDTSKCEVSYTPNSAAATTHTVKGTYGGASPHKGGDASASVTVNKRATQTAVVCGNPVAMNSSVTCTVTVTDVDTAGTKSGPGGSVTFAKNAGADGTFSNGGTCTLGAPAADKASCTISYSSPDVGVDAISATYNGSNVHATSASGVASGLAVTYDPGAGFVTGGGTISSPAGAYTADPSLTGQASFGFVSKYQKGQSTPSGQTEFQFQTAKFNFHSELYDWLVISGSKAQYKGTGTVNGVSGFSFMITAVDGSPDKFRMKVWNTATSAVVYDNKLGSPDTFDAGTTADTQSISGGSIVLHK